MIPDELISFNLWLQYWKHKQHNSWLILLRITDSALGDSTIIIQFGQLCAASRRIFPQIKDIWSKGMVFELGW